MATISIRINDADRKLIRGYANAKGISLGKLMRDATIEKIENEIDLRFFNSLPEIVHGSYSIKEIEKKLNV